MDACTVGCGFCGRCTAWYEDEFVSDEPIVVDEQEHNHDDEEEHARELDAIFGLQYATV